MEHMEALDVEPELTDILPDDYGYVGVDADGVRHYGMTQGEVWRAYNEAMRHLCKAAKHSGFSLAELRAQRRYVLFCNETRTAGVPAVGM